MTKPTNYFTREPDIFSGNNENIISTSYATEKQSFLLKYVNSLFRRYMFSRFNPKKTYIINNVPEDDVFYLKELIISSSLFDMLPTSYAESMPIWADVVIDILSIEGKRIQLIVQRGKISVAIISSKEEDTMLFYYKGMWSYQNNGELDGI